MSLRGRLVDILITVWVGTATVMYLRQFVAPVFSLMGQFMGKH
jgi:hypothetical protein